MYLIQAPPPPPGLPSPSLALAVVVTSKKASCIRVYEGNPNKISQTFMSKLYEGELLYTALEVFPGIILFPVDNQEIVLWNFRKDSEKILPVDIPNVTRLCRLSNNNILIGGTSKFGIFCPLQNIWADVAEWFSLGRQDPNSVFRQLPVEVYFHFVMLVFHYGIMQ
jgi:hypothetical protein